MTIGATWPPGLCADSRAGAYCWIYAYFLRWVECLEVRSLEWPLSPTPLSDVDMGLHLAKGELTEHLMHILFVDDTPDTREMYRMFFARNGHTAQTAPDGSEALRIIARDGDDLDLIILDYHMPGMTGIEVVEHLRQKKDVAAVPIILFTGDTQEDFEGRVRELGIACVVYKPIEPQKLIATAQTVLGAGLEYGVSQSIHLA